MRAITNQQLDVMGTVDDVKRFKIASYKMRLKILRILQEKDTTSQQFANIRDGLERDLLIYCEQIGISIKDMPALVFLTRERFMELMEYKIGHWIEIDERISGCLFDRYWFIWINVEPKVCLRRLRTGHMRPVYDWVPVKPRYTDYAKTLIHELVHVRFEELEHGPKFNKRTMEIAEGMRFPHISRKELMAPRPF
jgi:hypothetical protein